MAAFEVITGLLMITKGTTSRLGLLAGIAFLLAITPFGWEELPSPLMAAAVALLLKEERRSDAPRLLGASNSRTASRLAGACLTRPRRNAMPSNKLRTGLIALDLFMAIQGLGGGLGLLLGFIGTPREFLQSTPFGSFVGPGLILLLAVGGGSLLAAAITIRDGFWGAAASVVAGCVVLGWIVGEMYLVSWTHWLQPFEADIGLLMIAFGNLLAADPLRLQTSRRRPLHADAGR